MRRGVLVATTDLALADGRTLRVHDSGGAAGLTMLWHHGSPQTGALLEPLLTAAARCGIRLVSCARPAYGESSPKPGRDVASVAADVAAAADALGIARFAAMGASGGGPHALACAARLPGRVVAVVTLAGIAPFDAAGLDWFAGMAPAGAAALRAAQRGRAARLAFEATAEFDPAIFTARDWAALETDWADLGADAGTAARAGPDGLVDDDVAFVSPWEFPLAAVTVPVLVVQGDEDRVVPEAHGRWLAARLPRAEFRLRPGDGHVSVLAAVPDALDWLLSHVRATDPGPRRTAGSPPTRRAS